MLIAVNANKYSARFAVKIGDPGAAVCGASYWVAMVPVRAVGAAGEGPEA